MNREAKKRFLPNINSPKTSVTTLISIFIPPFISYFSLMSPPGFLCPVRCYAGPLPPLTVNPIKLFRFEQRVPAPHAGRSRRAKRARARANTHTHARALTCTLIQNMKIPTAVFTRFTHAADTEPVQRAQEEDEGGRPEVRCRAAGGAGRSQVERRESPVSIGLKVYSAHVILYDPSLLNHLRCDGLLLNELFLLIC